MTLAIAETTDQATLTPVVMDREEAENFLIECGRAAWGVRGMTHGTLQLALRLQLNKIQPNSGFGATVR